MPYRQGTYAVDKAYDNRKHFNLLDDLNAESTLGNRKNAPLLQQEDVH
jgi:hypothetical protein